MGDRWMIWEKLTDIFKRKKPLLEAAGRAPAPAESGLMRPEDMALRLETVMRGSEADFLKLGDQLQRLYTEGDAIAREAARAAAMIGSAEGDGTFRSRVDRLTRLSLDSLLAYESEVKAHLEMFAAGMNELDRLCGVCPVIEKAGMSLRVIGLNIAVECTRSPETREMFGSFVDEIRALAVNITEISGNIYQDSHAMRTREMAAHKRLSEALERFNQLRDQGEKLVDEAVSDIRNVMAATMGILNAGADRGRRISAAVGDVVMAVQFHDIARQRGEHISEALRDLGKQPQSSQGGAQSGPEDLGALHPFYGVGQLQAAQLKGIIDEIGGARMTCVRAFEGLSSLVSDLRSDIAVFSSGDPGELALDARIQSLRNGLVRLGDLLGEGTGLERQIMDLSREISETAAHLTGHIGRVSQISHELHLKALNAIIKSARVGSEGRSLEVLAQEVSRLSRQSHSFVSDVVAILKGLTQIEADTRSRADQTATGTQMDAAGIRSEMEKISQIYQTFKADMAALCSRAHVLESEIHAARSGVDFMMELGAGLSGVLDAITEMLNRMGLASLTEGSPDGETWDKMAGRYTMESERILHHQAMGTSAAAIAADMDGGDDDGNCVLFDADEPAQAEPGDNPPDEAGAAGSFSEELATEDGVDLWGDPPADAPSETAQDDSQGCSPLEETDSPDPEAAPEAGRKPDGGGDLGDNVELF